MHFSPLLGTGGTVNFCLLHDLTMCGKHSSLPFPTPSLSCWTGSVLLCLITLSVHYRSQAEEHLRTLSICSCVCTLSLLCVTSALDMVVVGSYVYSGTTYGAALLLPTDHPCTCIILLSLHSPMLGLIRARLNIPSPAGEQQP